MFDSLLAKLITHSPSNKFETAVQRSLRALSEFRIEGVATNIPFLMNVLTNTDFIDGSVHTRWVDEKIADLAIADTESQQKRWIESAEAPVPVAAGQQASPLTGTAPVMVDTSDPLALFSYDRQVKEAEKVELPAEDPGASLIGPDGSIGVGAPIQGTIIQISVSEGDSIRMGQEMLIMEAMKMEHVIKADVSGIVKKINVEPGDIIVCLLYTSDAADE